MSNQDFKLAADAIRETAEWKDRAILAEAKVAAFERKEKVEALRKLAEQKGAQLPNVDLMKCSEDTLKALTGSVKMIGHGGTIKLASVEEEDVDSSATPTKARSELDEFLLDPSNFQI